MDANAAEALPQFLDPVLDYLYDVLPPPFNNILTTVLSHGATLANSLYRLFGYLSSSSPTTWDAQTILPPLISVLAAYLALLSLWRTTSWMVRTSLWFAKWGTILAALAGGAGYFAAQGGGEGGRGANGAGRGGGLGLGNLGFGNVGEGAGGGIARAVGGMVWDAMNGQQDRNTRTSPRTRSSTRRGGKAGKERPAAWDSFDEHNDYHEEQESSRDYARARGAPDVEQEEERGTPPVDAQKIMGQIVGFAGRMGWLDAMKGVVEGAMKNAEGEDDGKESASGSSSTKGGPRKESRGKAKAKAKGKGTTR
jgi:hypothetical protein